MDAYSRKYRAVFVKCEGLNLVIQLSNFCLVYSIGCNKKKQGMDGKSLAKDSS